MLEYLEYEKLLEVHEKAAGLGLTSQRERLLGGLSNAFVAQLPLVPAPDGQMLSDLSLMNQISFIQGGIVPLQRWLQNAAYAMALRPDQKQYFRELADEVMRKRLAGDNAAEPASGDRAVPERIIFVNDMVPFTFLRGAERAGRSTARLVVPSFSGGEPRNWPNENKQKRYFGTGWLIGPRHVITNHHVVNARDPGEADAADSDFRLQANGTSVQFDYDGPTSETLSVGVARLAATDKRLDYALLELTDAPGRPPLPLWGGPLQLGADDRLPVNIIQHPGGHPKQMGIRNNLAARLTEDNLAYFTDTEGGSSGSPVCNDDWIVLALHKASDPTLGRFEYQGKTTVWVNIGTRIDRIIEDLGTRHAPLWASLAAEVVR